MKRNFYLFIILFVSSLAAQTRLEGLVVAPEDTPIAAEIKVVNGQSLTTDINGKFAFEVPSVKNVMVIFSASEMKSDTLIFNCASGGVQKLKVQLDYVTFNTVVVEGAETYDLPKPKLLDIPSPTEDFLKVLNTELGVTAGNELSSGYSVRGGNFDENVIYVNGIEIYRPFLVRSGEQEGLSFVNGNLVNDVYFSAGGFEAKYGDKLSSVLDVNYKRPQKVGGSVMASLLGLNAHLEGASKNRLFTFVSGVRWRTNQYLMGALNTTGAYQPNFLDAQAFLTYNPNENWEIGLLGVYSLNQFNFIPETRETTFGTVQQTLRLKVFYEGQERDKFENFTTALSGNYRSRDKSWFWHNHVSLYKTIETVNYDILGAYFLSDVEIDLGSESLGESVNQRGIGNYLNHARNILDAYVINANSSVKKAYTKVNEYSDFVGNHEFGMDYKSEFILDEISQWEMIDSAGFNLPAQKDSIGYQNPNAQDYQYLNIYNYLAASNQVESHRMQLFYQHSAKWRFLDSNRNVKSFWKLTGGLRAHYWTYNDQWVFSPRVQLEFAPYIWSEKKNEKKFLNLRLAGGWYYQPPFYREYRRPDGSLNQNIKAQESIHYIFGVDHVFNVGKKKRPFKFMSEIYWKQMKNIIPYRIENVQVQYLGENNAKARAFGIDAKLHAYLLEDVESWISVGIMNVQEDLENDFYYDYYNAAGEKIGDFGVQDRAVVDSSIVYPGYIPKPTDRRFKFALFFQDEMPKLEQLKVNLSFLFISGFPFGPKDGERYQDVLRSTAYKRVDMGLSYDLMPRKKEKRSRGAWRHLNSMTLALEFFNLLDINNIISYDWVTDVSGRQYAIPNNLTSRRVNLKFYVSF